MKLPNSVNMCDNAPQTFTASVQVPNVTYQWFLNNNPIAGATNASYTATQPGVYTVKVYIQEVRVREKQVLLLWEELPQQYRMLH